MSQEEMQKNQYDFEQEFFKSVDEQIELEKDNIKRIKIDNMMIKTGLLNRFIKSLFPNWFKKVKIGIYIEIDDKRILDIPLKEKGV